MGQATDVGEIADPVDESVPAMPKNWAQVVSIEDLFRFLMKLSVALLCVSLALAIPAFVIAVAISSAHR
jgi:hypothetical protein